MKKKLLSFLMFSATLITLLTPMASASAHPGVGSYTKSVEGTVTGIPDVTAETAIVADAATGEIYYQKSMHQQMYPASITKIMTGLLAVEKGSDSDVITVQGNLLKGEPANSARINLMDGEQITQEEALYTMFLASANDSANALAIHTGGNIDNFVAMMNARAKELGTEDTHFSNPNGLPDANNYSSAYDMALITKQALTEPKLMKYFGATDYTLPATNMRTKAQEFTTLHKMMKGTVYYYEGVIAGKTGWETMSGHTLVTAAQKNGRTLICVVMKSSSGYTVYKDTIALLNYGFSAVSLGTNASYLQKPVTAVVKPTAVKEEPKPVKTDIPIKKAEQPAVSPVPAIIAAAIVCFAAMIIALYRRSLRTRGKYCTYRRT